MSTIRDKAESAAIKFVTSFINFFYPKVLKGIQQIITDGRAITWRNIIIDVTDVAASMGMFLVLNIIALFIFIIMPAGKDVLLIMVEDIIMNYQIGNLVGLIIGVVAWSIVSEFAARYSIYVSDNSALTLDDKRVKFRKTLQKAFAAFFLLLPYLLVIGSLIIIFINSNAIAQKESWPGYLIAIGVFYFLLNKISHLYFDNELKCKMRSEREMKWFNRLVILPDKELEWAEKLYGIYNTHVYSFPKASNFREDPNSNDFFSDGGPRTKLEDFIKSVIDTGNVSELLSFPQDEKKLIKQKKIPQQFRLVGFSKEPGKDQGNYFWKYRVPVSFYRTLHRQVRIIFFSCLTIFLAISFLPVAAYEYIGAPALIFISFGCICGLYVGIIYLDYTNKIFKRVPIRLLILVLFLVASRFNEDHPVRTDLHQSRVIETRYKRDKLEDSIVQVRSISYMKRLSLQQHFDKWAKDFVSDSTHAYTYSGSDKSIPKICFPVLFVCAEGGALRTGAFSSYTLSLLQSSLAARDKGSVDLNKSIYGMSGVSGGSLGLGTYYAYNYLTTRADQLPGLTPEKADSTFYSTDFLSPLIGKMFFGEFLQLFIPWHVENFDRAIALEKSWENGYEKVIKEKAENIFGDNYSRFDERLNSTPALYINTTEVETGLQCWLSNVESGNFMFGDERDLFKSKVKDDIHFSTMINFSSRFPGFSPAGMVRKGQAKKYHYVDGGYVENTGAATMLEMFQTLQLKMKDYHIMPFVLMFRYSPEKENTGNNISWFNELYEIMMGIYNTRSGRTNTAVQQLKNYIRQEFGTEVSVVPLDVQSRSSPQNWALSKNNLENIMKYSHKLYEKGKEGDLGGLYFFNSEFKKLKER